MLLGNIQLEIIFAGSWIEMIVLRIFQNADGMMELKELHIEEPITRVLKVMKVAIVILNLFNVLKVSILLLMEVQLGITVYRVT